VANPESAIELPTDKPAHHVDELTPQEQETYSWQLDVRDFGHQGQLKLRNASVLISRVGGLGSVVAYELAAAGVGRLILAHAGDVQPSDLNRQLLMTHDWIGKPRIESATRRLKELNPCLQVISVAENIDADNADRLVAMADCVVDAAPMFQERLAMNDAAQRRSIPVVEAAMFELEATLTVIHPPETATFRDWVPEVPPTWKRRFPVFGAVSGTVGSLAAMEAIKLIAGFGEPLKNRLLRMDLRTMRFHTIELSQFATQSNKPPGGT
jgi:molybdopterin/thiamine biosynthesis adenylyltransferase